MNLMMLLEMASTGFGERTAVGSLEGPNLTYAELYAAAANAADRFDTNDIDSAADVPHGVVTDPGKPADEKRPDIPWHETIFYECNLRGFTMQHPAIATPDGIDCLPQRHL